MSGLILLLLSLLGALLPQHQVLASVEKARWLPVNIPAEGVAGDWVLAKGSDVRHLTVAGDGTLYAYANPTGTDYTLFKSADEGYSWSYTGEIEDEIVDIAVSPDDADTVYYATKSQVYKSGDAGGKFTVLPSSPGGAGSNNVEITSIDVAQAGGNGIVAAGTRDTDAGQFGGVYTLDEGELSAGWVNTSVGSYDVYAVAFVPDYAVRPQLTVVATNEIDTFVISKIGSVGWGGNVGDARLDRDNSGIPTPVAVNTSAAVAFPVDYNERGVLFVAIDTGVGNNGDVYMINGMVAPGSSIAIDLNIGFGYGSDNIDVTGLAVSGNAADAGLLAGAADSAQVYYSIDGGISWSVASRPPTGGGGTCVAMATDFDSSSRAYAATSGTESAFSYTGDGGAVWSQIGLVDTEVSRIVDLSPSPVYSQDNTLFMVTWGGGYSLWYSSSGGTRWERVLATSVDQIDRVELSPEYGSGSQVIFLAGKSSGNPAILRSTNNGRHFVCQPTHDPDTNASFDIKTWMVVDDNILFIGSFDGSDGLVYRTTSSGFFYEDKAIAGSQSLHSLALSPGYDGDGAVLAGNTDGWVYWSDDNGTLFKPLPLDATSAPLTGNITVAFDPGYSRNNTVYAASDTPDEGIYRFIIGKSTSWESIDATLPGGGTVDRLIVSANGALYAANSKAGGGMERCLNPTYPLGPSFEAVTRGLDGGATLSGLLLCDSQLWSSDTTNNRVMTFIDSLATPVILTSPPDQGTGVGTIINYDIQGGNLDWESLSGATKYKWQLDHEKDFSSVPAGFEGDTRATTARLPTLEPVTTYYWRVRATEPVLSLWSDKWSFTTSLGIGSVTLHLDSPKAGASDVDVKPVFQWTPIAGADSYEFLLSTDASFSDPLIVRVGDYALPATAWQCDMGLDYDTTYYWKVRAVGSDSCSVWSAVGAFTTKPPLSPGVTLSAEPTPSPSPPPPQSPIPDWAKRLMYLGGGLLVAMVAVLVVLVIFTVKLSKR